jgi:hypothetical protein
MSIKTKPILSGKIDNTSLINFPTYLKVENTKQYRLSVRDNSLPLQLKFKLPSASSNANSDNYILDLPIFEDKISAYNCFIDWGDCTQLTFINSFDNLSEKKKHTYKLDAKESKEYIVSIYGTFSGFNNSLYKLQADSKNPFEYLTEVLTWRKLYINCYVICFL